MNVVIKDSNTVIDTFLVTDLGMLGELTVWHKLKQLGYDGELYTFAGVGQGCDIKLNNGTTIEVKSARPSIFWDTRKGKSYDFRVGTNYAFNVKSSPADFVIIYVQGDEGSDELFYVCPTGMLNKGVNKIYKTATRWLFFKDNWDLLRLKGAG